MEADTLTTINTTARLDSTAYPDSTAIMLNDWHYTSYATPPVDTKCWLQDSIQLIHQRNATNFTRHDGIFRSDKMMSESLLLVLLLMETLLVAYLIKNGLKFLNNSIRNVFISDGRADLSEESGQKWSQFSQYLWVLSIVVIALFAPILINIGENQEVYELDSWLFLRLFLYAVSYFILKFSIFRMLGWFFFNSYQTKRWISASKTTLSFFAFSLTPVLIFSEIGLQMNVFFILSWVIGFLIITKIWLFAKAINIFSIKIGDFLYLILYLCALEILPILLFYKGLFLL